MADLNGNGILISGSVGVGNFRNWDALDNLSLQSHYEMAAGRGFAGLGILICQTVKIIPVLAGRGAWVCHIMNHNIVHPLPAYIWPGKNIFSDKILSYPARNLHSL